MGGGHNPPATIANPRHAALVLALSQAESLQTPVDERLDSLVSAMTAKAWTGGTSAAFGAELAGHKKGLHTATQGCVDNVQAALSSCSKTIPNPAAKGH